MIIVTGANGFIGSALVWELNNSGRNDIICVDSVSLSERPEPLKNRKYQQFLDKNALWAFLENPEVASAVDSIVHMGACSSTTELNVEFLTENNLEYTRKLWNWCTRENKPFVFASSGAVYGDGSQGFDDMSPPEIFKPLNPYGESKAAFDRWAVLQTKTPPLWLGLRFFNVFGPNEYHKGDMASVVFKAFNQISQTGELQLFRSHNAGYANGQQMRDFVYVKDITRWILELLKIPSLQSGIYNMGNGVARPWLDLASQVFTSMGAPMKIQWIDIPLEMRPRYQYFTEAKIQKLMAQAISRPQWPLERGVADYIENHLMPSRRGKDAGL